MNQSFDRLSVKISLTAKGESVYKEVIKTVYKYINKFKKMEPSEVVYKQLQTINQIKFENLEKIKGWKYALELSTLLNFATKDEHAKQIISAPYDFKHFNKKDIEERF